MKVSLQQDQWDQIVNALLDSGEEEDVELIKEIKYQLYKETSIIEFRQNLRRSGYKI